MPTKLHLQTLEALQPAPNAVAPDTIAWKPFDKAPATHYLRFLGDRAVGMNVNLPHDAKRAVAILTELSAEDLDACTPEKPVCLQPSTAIQGTPFQLRAVLHPNVAKSLMSKTTGFLTPVTFKVFPAYRCEFTDDDDADESRFRIVKIVTGSDWSRKPAPALSMRFHLSKSGVKSTGGKRMGIFPPREVDGVLTDLASEDGFADIENYERRMVRIEHADGKYTVIQGKDQWTPRADGLMDWFHVFAIQGSEAAERARVQYVL